MIQKIDINEVIKSASTIELIRANLPLAEIGKKGLAGNNLINAFQSKVFLLKKGESGVIGKIAGLCVIKHSYSGSEPTIVFVDNYTKSITQIAGKHYTSIPMEIMWAGEKYNTELSIKSTYDEPGISTGYAFAFQFVH